MPNKYTYENLPVRFWEKVIKTSSGCWLWTSGVSKSHPYGIYQKDGKAKKPHRISYEFCVGPIPKELYVCHTCNTKNCVNPEHLYLATHSQNIKDAARDGLMPGGINTKGEVNGQSKLTELDVREIRIKWYSGQASQGQLALEYGVGQPTIHKIVHYQRWKHV